MLKHFNFILWLLLSTSIFAQTKKTNNKVTPANTPTDEKPVYKRKLYLSELSNNNDIYYFKDKPFTGTCVDVFDDKTKKQELDFVNGILHGKKIEYFKGGILVRAVIQFSNGMREGTYHLYHSNGNIKEIGKYSQDLLDSTVVAFYENGNKKYEFQYNKGVKYGLSLTYFSNGNLEQKSFIVNDVPEGIVETYYEAGNIRYYANYKNGFRHGKYERYHLTGIKAEESYYIEGIQDSISLFWDNVFGTLTKQEYYKKGKKEGLWITYNFFADTLTVKTYENDVLNGPFRIYATENIVTPNPNNDNFEKGKKQYSSSYYHELDEYGTYVNGQLDGVFKSGLYHREKHVEGNYSNGIPVGEWKYYNARGKVVLYELYNEDGELIKQKPKLKKQTETE